MFLLFIQFLFVFARGNSLALPKDNSTLCSDFFHALINSSYQGPNISVEINNFMLYSGHNINDLGMYKNCTELPTQKYSLLKAQVGFVGFCGPSFCNVSQMEAYVENMLQTLSNLTRRDLTGLNIGFVDPDQTKVEKGIWFYVAIAIYTILFGLSLAGTVYSNFVRTADSSKPDLYNLQDLASKDELLINKESYVDESVIHKADKKPLPSHKLLSIRIIECFDIASNLKDLFKNEQVTGHDQNLNVFNGIRTISFGWVVLGHTFSFSFTAKNFLYAKIFKNSIWALLAIAGFYAVDTFFYMSGFFTGFLLVSKLKKMKLSMRNYAMLLFHRWIRLWPAYLVAILFFWKISVHFGSGPFWWSYVSSTQDYCNDGAWKNLLFMDNVLNSTNSYCFTWGWYLACDFQMFLMAPFICWLYLKNRSFSHYLLWILIATSTIASYMESSDSGITFILVSNNSDTGDYFLNYYINPVVRMSPYLLGIFTGFMFKEHKQGEKNFFTWIKQSSIRSFVCSLIGFGLIIFIIFFPRSVQTGGTWSPGFATTFSVLSRPFWVVGIFLLIAPCLVGNMKGLSSFLRNSYFTLVARISYAAYLIHYVFLDVAFNNADQLYGLFPPYQMSIAFSVMLIACAAAIVLHVLVEKPIANIETKILNSKKDRSVRTIENPQKIEA